MAEDPPVRVLLADDHPILRAGLRKLLESEPGFVVAGEVGDGRAAIDLARTVPADLMLLDLAMPTVGGLDVLRELSKQESSLRVVVLTASIDPEQVTAVLKLGARGVLMKSAATELLFTCARRVMAGEYWVGSETMAGLVQALGADAPRDRLLPFGLTARELEVLALVADGAPNREIADRLGISEQTVKHHLTRIFDKTGQSSRVELVLFAQRHNLTP
jgi:DNA-binding NarL/FixJ family response regulator